MSLSYYFTPRKFVETDVRDLENELFFYDHLRNNFVVIFEFEHFCAAR